MSTLRIMTIDDVQNDEDLKQYYAYNRKLVTFLAREFANTAAELSAMLKAHDERAGGKKRRGKVVRPMALAAGVLILVSKYITLSSRRFAAEYQQEIEANRRRPQRGRRNFTFGG